MSVTVKFLASFEEIMTESINNKKSKLAETMGQFPILDQITKQSKVMMGYCCKVQNFWVGQQVYNEGQTADSIYLIQSGEFELSKTIYVEGDSNTQEKHCIFSQMVTSKKEKIQREIFDESTKVFINKNFIPSEFVQKIKHLPKTKVKVSVINESDMFGIIEDLTGCSYR